MSPQTASPAQQLVRVLALALQACRLYPAGHPQRKNAENRVRQIWGPFLAQGYEVVIDFYNAELRLGGDLPERISPELMVELGPAARAARVMDLHLAGEAGVEQLLEMLRVFTSGAERPANGTGAVPMQAPPPTPRPVMAGVAVSAPQATPPGGVGAASAGTGYPSSYGGPPAYSGPVPTGGYPQGAAALGARATGGFAAGPPTGPVPQPYAGPPTGPVVPAAPLAGPPTGPVDRPAVYAGPPTTIYNGPPTTIYSGPPTGPVPLAGPPTGPVGQPAVYAGPPTTIYGGAPTTIYGGPPSGPVDPLSPFAGPPTGPVAIYPAAPRGTGAAPVFNGAGPQATGAVRTTGPVAAPPQDVRQALHLLGTYWTAIEQAGRRDDAAMAWLLNFVSGFPGDGLSRPVQLYGGTTTALSTLEHALDVARLAALSGRAAGIAGDALAELIEAALCADIGMRAIPLELVQRPLRLTQEDFRTIRQHPLVGARWLLATPGIPTICGVVAFEHHLRRDGRGYPHTAASWVPHPASRLVQACDTYAALRTPRPFRPPLAEPDARALMRKLSGAALDPESVELLLTRGAPAGCVAAQPA